MNRSEEFKKRVVRRGADNRGADNHWWLGDDAKYTALHIRVHKARGKASERSCACGKQAQDWANLTGIYENVDDYAPMCRSCHIRFDKER